MRKRFARASDLGLTGREFAVLRRLDTPQKVQAFVHNLRQNFELDGQNCRPVREVLRSRRAHCIEGAMVAAAALWVHGEPPLLLDTRAERDYDHVVSLFRRHRLDFLPHIALCSETSRQAINGPAHTVGRCSWNLSRCPRRKNLECF